MQLLKCPHCAHWVCLNCNNSGLWVKCCKCGEKTPAKDWYRGRRKGGKPHDLDKSPRLGTGRPEDASKAVAESLILFCERYEIPLNAIGRHTKISPWAIRQARAGKRSLSRMKEALIKATMERIKAGQLWLRPVSRQRWDLVWINPLFPCKPHCPTRAIYCAGGLLPGSCPRRWNRCILSGKDWEATERVHQGQSKKDPSAERRA